MEKLKELYKDLISRFKYLESEDAVKAYGNDLEGRKRENIQIMVAIGQIVIEDIYKTKPESSLILENKRLKEENERLKANPLNPNDINSDFLKIGDKVLIIGHDEKELKEKNIDGPVFINQITYTYDNETYYYVHKDLDCGTSIIFGYRNNELKRI